MLNSKTPWKISETIFFVQILAKESYKRNFDVDQIKLSIGAEFICDSGVIMFIH